MSKVQITCVGGAPMPVYQGVLLHKPDLIVMIHSDDSLAAAETLRQVLSIKGFPRTELVQVSTSKVGTMENEIRTIFERYRDDEISVNITGGLKPWNFLCYKQALLNHPDSHVFYLLQSGKVLSLQGSSPMPRVEFDMKVQFLLLGHGVPKYNEFSLFRETERANYELMEQHYDDTRLLRLLDRMRRNNVNDLVEGDKSVRWNAQQKQYDIRLSKKESGYDHFVVSGKMAHRMVVDAAWFELVVADLLAEIYGPENIWMNCVFAWQDKVPINEFDILVNTGQKLLFVECKTKIDKPTDIDKFANGVKVYGGIGSKSLFCTLNPMNAVQAKKCEKDKVPHIAIHRAGKRISSKELKTFIEQFINKNNT